ncbi:MAG TPA: outer membrane protein assembly factor BamD [Candidatus Azoamicus sp.]
MLIKNIRLLVLLLLFNCYIFSCYALSYTAIEILKAEHTEEFFENKLIYYTAKKYYYKGDQKAARNIFVILIQRNTMSSIYSYKSRLYLAVINFKKGHFKTCKKICKNILSIKHMLNIKTLNYAYFLKGRLLYGPSKKILRNINRYKMDQKYIKKAFNSLSKITLSKVYDIYIPVVEKARHLAEIELKKHRLYVAEYYFKRGYYLTVIKRLHHYNHSCKDQYDLMNNYLLIRCYNELYLGSISEKLLAFKPSKYFKYKTKKI